MKIIITENQYKKLITEDRVDFLRAKFVDGEKQLIDSETFGKFIEADPTVNKQFVQWLCQIFLNKKLRLEDLYKATEYLKTYSSPKIANKLTSDQKNIYAAAGGQLKIPDLQTLFEIIKPFKEVKSQKEVSDKIKKDAPTVFKSANWIVVTPKTKEASCVYGANTEWCTAATSSDNYFDECYSESTPLYINIDRKTGKKFQFYVGKSNMRQFMDENDKAIDLNEFLEENPDLAKFYNNLWFNSTEKLLKFYGIENYTINPDGLVDVDGNVDLKELTLKKLPFKFGKVVGYFDCSENNLTSLQGAPTSVGGYFNCSYNNLTSLQGAPTSVGGGFYCPYNNLTSLQGAPTSVGVSFTCSYNNLTSLQGAPTSVGGSFYCSYNNLTSLQGAPTSVGGNFDCREQKNGKKFAEQDVKDVCKVKGDVIV